VLLFLIGVLTLIALLIVLVLGIGIIMAVVKGILSLYDYFSEPCCNIHAVFGLLLVLLVVIFLLIAMLFMLCLFKKMEAPLFC
jgi:hypothetical protein